MLSAGGEGRPAERTRLGVLGWPVSHSRSPAIQNAALAAVGLPGWRYQLLPAPPEVAAEVLAALPGAGFRGINVTLPHKSLALDAASEPTQRAREIGAANTLTFEADGSIVADNTDAPGLIAALPFGLAGAEALVLGAGGSARAAVWALLDAGADVRIWNRTFARAEQLCRELGGRPVRGAGPAAVLVNCTSVGLDGSPSLAGLPLVAEDLADYGCVVDLVYGSGPTALVTAARSAGVTVVEGLEILVAQGALSFERFTGRPAPVEVMRSAAGLGRPGESPAL